MIVEYAGKTPQIGKNVFIAPNATVIGDVKIMEEGSILAAGSVLREKGRLEKYNLAAGVPAVVKKVLSKESAQTFLQPVHNYLELSKRHAKVHGR